MFNLIMNWSHRIQWKSTYLFFYVMKHLLHWQISSTQRLNTQHRKTPVCFRFCFEECILVCKHTHCAGKMTYSVNTVSIGAHCVCAVFGGHVLSVLVEETQICTWDPGKTTCDVCQRHAWKMSLTQGTMYPSHYKLSW